jgi:radical SAM protein with 4Fe4S-binding SPASM domain
LGQTANIDEAAVRAALERLLEQAEGTVSVEIIGGEPLERPARELTLRLLSDLARDPRCSATTLCTAITSGDALAAAFSLCQHAYVSIDFSRDPTNRKLATTKRIEQLVGLAKATGTSLAINSVMSSDDSETDITRFVEQCISAGVKEFGAAHISSRGLTDAELARIVDQYYHMFKLRLAYRDQIHISNGILDSLEIHLKGGSRSAGCECAQTSVAIEPDGRVVHGVCVDHLRQVPDVEAFRALQEERLRALSSGPCKDCELWRVCYGGCMTEAIRINGSPLSRATERCRILLGLNERVSIDLNNLSRSH